jgi:putative ABC transport system permease protein
VINDVRLVIGLVVLIAVIVVVLRIGRVPVGWAPVLAVLRGGAQLLVVGLILRGAITALPFVALALVVMSSVAVWTAASRLRELPGALGAVSIACLCGAGGTLTIAFGTGMLPWSSRYLLALGGIVIGGSMTAASLAGRGLLAGMRAGRAEIEAWLSIGATSRQALAAVARRAAAQALVPAIDQTRTTGLVTLPGAFIGALLGGASPTDAARFQIVVLVSLMAAESIVAVVLMQLLGAQRRIPLDE